MKFLKYFAYVISFPFALVLSLVLLVPIIGILCLCIILGVITLPIIILYMIVYCAYEIIKGE